MSLGVALWMGALSWGLLLPVVLLFIYGAKDR